MKRGEKGILRAISAEWLVRSQRKIIPTIEFVDGAGSGYGNHLVPVLKENVGLKENVSPAPAVEAGQPKRGAANKLHHCLRCKTKSGLQTCTQRTCNVALCWRCSPACSGQPACSGWVCGLHRCQSCGRKNASVGGSLFLCICCPTAKCECCLPGGISSTRLVAPTAATAEQGFGFSGQILMVCKTCDANPLNRQVCNRLAKEPSKPLDLSAFILVGNVQESSSAVAKLESE